jgi:hypothetical protein
MVTLVEMMKNGRELREIRIGSGGPGIGGVCLQS